MLDRTAAEAAMTLFWSHDCTQPIGNGAVIFLLCRAALTAEGAPASPAAPERRPIMSVLQTFTRGPK